MLPACGAPSSGRHASQYRTELFDEGNQRSAIPAFGNWPRQIASPAHCSIPPLGNQPDVLVREPCGYFPQRGRLSPANAIGRNLFVVVLVLFLIGQRIEHFNRGLNLQQRLNVDLGLAALISFCQRFNNRAPLLHQLRMQIARIRLSDKTSRLHPRHVVPKPAQAYEPKVPVEVREWIHPALASPDLMLEAQPPAQPHSRVVVDRRYAFETVPTSK